MHNFYDRLLPPVVRAAPTVTKLLKNNELEYEMRGSHRKVRLGEVMRYAEESRQRRDEALTDLVQTSETLGLYDKAEGDMIRR
jgi:uncharacterized protein YbjQ (UPF0145 family)